MSNPEDRELRLQCADLASRALAAEPLALAQAYYGFVTGASDKTPREQVNAALDQAGVS